MAKLYTVLSPASPGKTSFTLNMGYLYAKTFPDRRVLLVDFNFLKPDLAAFLDLLPGRPGIKTVNDLHVLLAGYETIVLSDFFATPFADVPNLCLLPGDINNISCFDDVAEEQWFHFFTQLRDSSDAIFFDTGRDFDTPAFQYLISQSDQLFILTEADPLTLFHTRTLLNHLISQGRSADIRLLLLRYRKKTPYSLEYISDLLPEAVCATIPELSNKDYQAQFLDATLLATRPNHPYTKTIQTFLSTLEDTSSHEDKRRLLWSPSFLTKNSSVK